jgi:hypothetical protein
MKFNDIPQLTNSGHYQVNASWGYLEQMLAGYMEPGCGAILDLEPDFQRGHVWTPEQQTAYVEFCLRGGSSGREILFNCVGWESDYRGPFVIVDGKQRLHAVRQFLANKVPVFGGHLYQEFTDSLRMCHSDFIFRINNLKTRKAVLTWYLELNGGGTPHTKDELDRVKELLQKEKS